jgi:hypothetical protein
MAGKNHCLDLHALSPHFKGISEETLRCYYVISLVKIGISLREGWPRRIRHTKPIDQINFPSRKSLLDMRDVSMEERQASAKAYRIKSK